MEYSGAVKVLNVIYYVYLIPPQKNLSIYNTLFLFPLSL